MRLIDADACIDYIRNNNQHAWEVLAYAPTIDAVEVVRCKDCKYRYVGNSMYSKGFNALVVTRWDCFRTEDNKDTDFCSCGERKTD